MILCLQNTPGLSRAVAHLGLGFGRIRWDRLVSGPVVVSLGGQSWTWAECTKEREASVMADEGSPARAAAGRRIRRRKV